MKKGTKTLYLCYLTTQDGVRISTIYSFLQTVEGRKFFDTYSTKDDSIKKFLDGLRYMVRDETVL